MNTKLRNAIISTVAAKALIREQITRQLEDSFEVLCALLQELAAEYNKLLKGYTVVSYERPAQHVAQFTINEDTLIFAQHTDVFQFDRDHEAWKTPYVTEDAGRSYAGIVNVYNFLAESFKYDRDEDIGYLIARIFINKDGAFFVEGKRQRNMGVAHYGEQPIDKNNWRRFVETAIKYAAEFDLLAPPYETEKLTDLIHLKDKILKSKTKTAKRLGFSFNSDDVS
ncbi:MAG: hypothetical protein II951_09770 [Bacteroidales bacterium]|nr:hypothetical protein [Bacteroidales bacterium]